MASAAIASANLLLKDHSDTKAGQCSENRQIIALFSVCANYAKYKFSVIQGSNAG